MLLTLVAPHDINRHVLKLQEKEEERSTSTPHVCFVFRSGAGLLSASKICGVVSSEEAGFLPTSCTQHGACLLCGACRAVQGYPTSWRSQCRMWQQPCSSWGPYKMPGGSGGAMKFKTSCSPGVWCCCQQCCIFCPTICLVGRDSLWWPASYSLRHTSFQPGRGRNAPGCW